MSKDYYEILQVEKNAEAESIKKAYRKKARKLHPDVNPSEHATDEFQELYEAYSVLSDPDLRHQYDIGILFNREFVPPPPPPEPPPYDNSWKYSYRYDSTSTFYTDYEANKRTSFWFCLVTLIFSMTFFTDLFFHIDLGTTTILGVKNKSLETLNPQDLDNILITTDQMTFEKKASDEVLKPGDMLELRESLIYRFPSFKKQGESQFRYMSSLPTIMYIIALIVFLSGLYGITPFAKPERKFNAAIVSSFFSFSLIVFLIFS